MTIVVTLLIIMTIGMAITIRIIHSTQSPERQKKHYHHYTVLRNSERSLIGQEGNNNNDDNNNECNDYSKYDNTVMMI